MIRKKAFTLSEVAVVIILVGVIAAVLIPYLVSTFQKEKWSSIYHRTFSETYQVLTMIALEEDCAKSISCTGIFHGSIKDSTKQFGDLFSSKMKLKTNCGLTTSGGSCFSHKVRTLLNAGGKDTQENIKDSLTVNPTGTNKNIAWDTLDFPYTFVTARGVSYALFSFGTDCLKSEYANINPESYLNFYVRRAGDTDTQNDSKIPKDDKDNQMLNLCGFIVIDVNAEDAPNVWGKDVFGIWVTDTKALGIYPFGGASDRLFYNKCKKTGIPPDSVDGRGCAARIIEDNWSIGYF